MTSAGKCDMETCAIELGLTMFAKTSGGGYIPVSPGIVRKTLVFGDHTMMTEFLLEKGSNLASHRHPHEQTGYLVSGHMLLTIGEEEAEILPGDSWTIPGGVSHHAEILADSLAIEVFSPRRDEYLPQ